MPRPVFLNGAGPRCANDDDVIARMLGACRDDRADARRDARALAQAEAAVLVASGAVEVAEAGIAEAKETQARHLVAVAGGADGDPP